MLSTKCIRHKIISQHALRSIARTRNFSTSRVQAASYDDTVQNLKIGKGTRVLYQGFTGRVATSNAEASIEWGTNIVGGVTPNKEGEHLGLPLLPTVRKAKEQLNPDATAIFVAAQYAAAAIEDAIEAEIPLIVAVAEFIPLHDLLRITSILNTQSKSRLVGANSPGIIAPLGNCRIGFQPLPCYAPGNVGLVAKSGTLSYEAVGSLTRAGLGQSLCIGMGGDIVAGTNFVDALRVFENDDDTEAIVLVGEVGGRAEQDAAEWIKDYRLRSKNPKPITACVGGVKAVPGRIMGHAGAFASLGEAPSEVKYKALEDAGAVMVNHPAKFGPTVKKLLADSGRSTTTAKQSAQGSQKRGYHTLSRRLHSRPSIQGSKGHVQPVQKRGLTISGNDTHTILAKETGSTIESTTAQPQYFLAITVDRTNRCPAIMASPSAQSSQKFARAKTFPYNYLNGPDKATIQAAVEHLQLDAAPPAALAAVSGLIVNLVDLFRKKEAYALETNLAVTDEGKLGLCSATFSFDDSALKSAKRQADLQEYRQLSQEDADEVEASKDGIIYVKLADKDANIGTLINGAGLAMNANDALGDVGAKSTNFLDTGGKATSETVKKSFELLLRDERVRVVFVNIFGGITLCDMIAEGIKMAFKDLDMKIPVVVRLRGTNEELGQKIIAESGLPLHACDDFEEAAQKCIELANGSGKTG